MCTVTYISAENGVTLSSNRDESPNRSPKNITRLLGKFDLCFPQDTLAGGTWIAADDRARLICVLNGAFEKHHHDPPYRKSRGILALEYFNFSSIHEFNKQEFIGIEPFTLVVVESGNLHELRWDEDQLHHHILDPTKMYIWSSATLYDKQVRARRKSWFREWKSKGDFSLESIQKFHRFGGETDDHNGFVMNRDNIVRTVSITNIVLEEDLTTMYYHELLKDLRDQVDLNVRSNIAIR